MSFLHMKSGAAKWICWAVALFSLVVVIGFFLLYISANKTSLNIDVKSDTAGYSQVFFAGGGGYTQEKSSRSEMKAGRNNLVFPLKGEISSLRWDPLPTEGKIRVNSIYVSVLGIRVDVGSIELLPLYEINKIDKTSGQIFIDIKEGAGDPRLNVSLDFNRLKKARVYVGFTLGGVIAFILAVGYFIRGRVRLFLNEADDVLSSLYLRARKDGFKIKEFGVLLAIGSVFYVYFLSSFSLSIDDERAAMRHDPSLWMSQGRWFVYLIEKFIFPQPAIPFAPYVFLLVAIAASYIMVLRSHKIQTSWKTYAAFPIFCAYPTWWLIAEFYSNTPALGIGFLFVSISTYLVFRESLGSDSKRISIFFNSMIVIMLSCAMAAYQSLVLLFVCLVFGSQLMRLMNSGYLKGSEKVENTFSVLFKSGGLAVLSIILYSILNWIAQSFVSADSGYIGNFINIKALTESPVEVVWLTFDKMLSIYLGEPRWFGSAMSFSGVVLGLATLSVISRSSALTPIRLFLWIGLLSAPFVLHFVAGGAALPMRIMVPLAYVSWVASVILIHNRRPALVLFSFLIVVMYQVQMHSITAQYVAAASITQSHDRLLAADIYRRIGELDEKFDRTRLVNIDVYGKKSINTLYANAFGGTMQGSFFAWDGGNLDRMFKYMSVMGYENISALPSAERIALTPVFNTMPIWPAAGSVRKFGEYYLVRLSKEPDRIHARFRESVHK